MGKNSWDKENTFIVGIIIFLISSILPSVCPTIVHLTAPLSANIVVTISNQSHHFFLSSFNTYIPHHSNPSSSLVLGFFSILFYISSLSYIVLMLVILRPNYRFHHPHPSSPFGFIICIRVIMAFAKAVEGRREIRIFLSNH